MTQVEKLLAMLMEMPRTFRFRDFTRIMEHLGYELDQKGSTSGSRVRFYRARDGRMLIISSCTRRIRPTRCPAARFGRQ